MPRQPLVQQAYLGLLVAATRRHIKQAVWTRVSAYHLTPQQFWILVAVAEHEGLSLRALGERQQIDQPTASRVIGMLTRRKLIRVTAAERDRRRSVIQLASAGVALAPRLKKIADGVRAAVIDGVSENDLKTTRRVLQKVIANMELFSRGADSD